MVQNQTNPAAPPPTSGASSSVDIPIELPELEHQFDKEKLLQVAVVRAGLLRLAMKGVNATEAAKIIGCCTATSRAHYREPEFRKEVLKKVSAAFEDIDASFIEKKKTLHEMIETQAYRSCEGLIQMLEEPDLHASLKVKIHQDFLNRHEDTKPLSGHMTHRVEPTDLKRASETASEMDNVIPMKKKA